MNIMDLTKCDGRTTDQYILNYLEFIGTKSFALEME